MSDKEKQPKRSEANAIDEPEMATGHDLKFTIRTDTATLTCSYDSELIVRRITTNLQRIVSRDNEGFDVNESVNEYVRKVFYQQVQRVLKYGLLHAETETQKRTLRELNKSTFHLEPNKVDRWAEEAARETRTEARRRLRLRMRGGSEPEYDLSKLREYHEQYYPTWRDAKRLYRQNHQHVNWPDIIKVAHPNLPQDLINKLGIQGASGANDLALEHAARLCGVPSYRNYSPRRLRQILNNDR